jgi:hypothetical protein
MESRSNLPLPLALGQPIDVPRLLEVSTGLAAEICAATGPEACHGTAWRSGSMGAYGNYGTQS